MARNRTTSPARALISVFAVIVCVVTLSSVARPRDAQAQPSSGVSATNAAALAPAAAPAAASAPLLGATDETAEPAEETGRNDKLAPPMQAASPVRESQPVPPLIVQDDAPMSVRSRPGFSMTVGMGVSRDMSGLIGSRVESIPAFQGQIGIGVGTWGLDVRLFANQASGRYIRRGTATAGGMVPTDMAVDRMALDLMMAFRPLWKNETTARWAERAVQSLTLNLGVGAENASVGPPSLLRFGALVGLYIDCPLTAADAATDLRVRLTARRMFATEGDVGGVHVEDSLLEIFAGLALVF